MRLKWLGIVINTIEFLDEMKKQARMVGTKMAKKRECNKADHCNTRRNQGRPYFLEREGFPSALTLVLGSTE
jgi:hypothetical protein